MTISFGLVRKSKDPAKLYKTHIEFGTPLQHNSHHVGFYLDFSTSVTGVAYDSCARCMGWFDESLSSSTGVSSYEASTTEFWSYQAKMPIPFNGSMGTETLCLPTHDCIYNYDFFKITYLKDYVYDWHWNGVLGLGPLKPGMPVNFVMALKEQGVIDNAVTTVILKSDDKDISNSMVVIGEHIEGTREIQKHHLVALEWPGTWTFKMPSF